jgi:ribosome biogenesis GTPase
LVDGGPPRARFAVYLQCGFRVLFASAAEGNGLDALRQALRDRRSVLCGPSGVGKSSLLNAIAPGLKLQVGDVGEVTHKGRHITTTITLHELPSGGWVADTAGLRKLNFWEVEPEHIAAAFPELASFLGRCRFNNCSHGSEDGCAIREAVQAGEADSRRVRSYLQMTGGET